MPPIGKPLKNDGPACRVCGCTEHNACSIITRRPHPSNPKGPAKTLTAIGCSWVKVEGATPPLCSACSGTEADIVEALGRIQRYIKQHGTASTDLVLTTVKAARARWLARSKLSP